MKQVISIIAPMYNEEGLVRQFVDVTLEALAPVAGQYDIEIVLVNDGSGDETLSVMREVQEQHKKEVTVVNLTRNFGLEGAVNAGLKVACGDAVVVMDGDLQDPPSLIPSMIELWEAGNDIVIAKRCKRGFDSFFKRKSTDLYYRVQESLSGRLKLVRNAANFRLLSRKAVDMLLSLPEVNGVFRITVPFLGMRTAIVEYERDKRYSGKTKYNLSSMIRYALDGLTGASIEPLRRVIIPACVSGILMVLFICLFFILSEVWKISMLTLSVMSFFFTLLFLCLALIGEYIAQIMIETKGRPTSLIYDVIKCENADNEYDACAAEGSKS